MTTRTEAVDGSPPTVVAVLGGSAGSIRIGHDPERDDYWMYFGALSMSVFGEEDDAPASPPRWVRGFSWPKLVEELELHRWWRLSPREVDPAYAPRLLHALKQRLPSNGWVEWMSEQAAGEPDGPRWRRQIDPADVGASLDEAFHQLGRRRVQQMSSFLEGLVGLWEPFLPADLDAILVLIPKEHWTLDEIARDHPSARVRELAGALRAAHEKGGT